MRTTIAVFVIVPLIAVVAAIPVAWGGWLSWTDVVIAAVFYAITAMGITVGDGMMDEPGQCTREAYDVLCSRVRNPRSAVKQIVSGGTPEGLNWFADLFANPAPDSGRRTIWATGWHKDLADYPKRIMQTYGYDQALLDTYGNGKFVPLRTGRAYKFFNDKVHVARCKLNYQPAVPITLTCDFNVDYMRWLVMQITPSEIVVLDEIALGFNGTTELGAREFCNTQWAEITKKRPVRVTGDATANSRSTNATRTDYEVIQDVLTKADIRVHMDVPESNPLVKDRVAMVNFFLSDRSRQKVVIAEHCTELIRDFQRVSWKDGGTALDQSTDPSLTHATDAFGYAAVRYAAYVGVDRARVGTDRKGHRTSTAVNPARMKW